MPIRSCVDKGKAMAVAVAFLAMLFVGGAGKADASGPDAGSAAARTERVPTEQRAAATAAQMERAPAEQETAATAAQTERAPAEQEAATTATQTERAPSGQEAATTAKAAAGQAAKPPSGREWSELQRQFAGVFVLSASRRSRQVALTFDDVPDPRFTPAVLDVLQRKRVKATFFAVGTRSKKHAALLRRIRHEGHDVGNHSFSHPDFSKLSVAQMRKQVTDTDKVIAGIVGFKPRLLRPPYGEILRNQLAWASDNGYTVVNWDVDSSDWRQLDAERVFRNVTRSIRPGSVVLMHAGGGKGQNLSGTIEALPRIIDWLRAHGYEPVGLTELLHIPVQRNG